MTPGVAVEWIAVVVLGSLALSIVGIMAAAVRHVWRMAGR